MNTGLKSYTKQLTQKIGAATVNVNLCKKNANLHIVLPLLSTKGLESFSTSLIYNYRDRGQNGIFGNGVKLDKFAKISENGGQLEMLNADGSTDVYTEGVINTETQCKISRVYDDSYQISSHFEVEDKYGNKMIYGQLSEYPEKIISKSGETLTLDFVSADKKISNSKDDVIKFNGVANKIRYVTYLFKDSDYESISLQYTNDNLTSIEYCNKNGFTVAHTLINYQSNCITVKDVMTDYRCIFEIQNNCVTSVTDGFGEEMKGSHKTTVKYENSKTTITSWNNTSVEYYFDSDGMPLYQIDSDGYVVETEFDSRTKLMTAQSSPFLIKGTQKNYFAGKSFADFSLTNVTREKVTLKDEHWKNILGDTVYKFTHTGSRPGYITFEVPIDCIATDSVTAIMWGRQLTNYTDNSCVKVDFQIDSQDADVFKKPIHDNEFELMLLGVTCIRTENEARFFIQFVGDVSIELGGLQIVKQDFGAFYNYDANNNAALISKAGENVKAKYDGNNMPQQITGVDTTILTYEYNDKGQPVKSVSSYNVEIVNEYDSKHPECLTKQTISNADKSKIIETQKMYSEDGRHVTKEFDELGNCVITNSYRSDKLIMICDALGTFTDFKYNSEGLIRDIIMNKDNVELAKATYAYDDKRRLTSVTLKNGSKYEFSYDMRGNIVEIKLNGVIVFAYTYDESTGNVLSQKHGENGDAYLFEYDSNNQISKVHYVKADGTTALRFVYTYNKQKQLEKVSDDKGVTLSSFEYDAEGNISKISNNGGAIKYSYDNLKNINNVSRTVQGKTIHESFENVSRSQSVHPQKMLSRFSKRNYFGLLENNANLIMDGKILSPVRTTLFSHGREGALPYLELESSQNLAYQLKDRAAGSNYEIGCIKFWFKPTSTVASKYIFGVKSSKRNSYYTVYMKNSKLYLEIQEENSSPRVLLSSVSNVRVNKWNFFALNFYNRDDGMGFKPNCDVTLTLNSETQFYTSTEKLLRIDVAPEPVYYIGRRYDGSSTWAFEGKIACICISPRDSDSYDNIKYYYNVTKDFIEDCQYIDTSAKTFDVSETVAFVPGTETQNMFEICPLHNSVKSISGTRPTKYSRRDGVAEDKDKSFTYNNKIKRYAYVADGSELAYKFGQNCSGTILMRVYIEAENSTQYLFEGKDANGKKLGLFRNSSKQLCINRNGTTITTNLTMTNDTWHTVGLSFEKAITQSSLGDFESGRFRVFLDGDRETVLDGNCNFTSLEIAVGRRFDEEINRHCTGTKSESYPLYGQIEMLCASDAYCSESTLNTLMKEIKCVTKTNEFDDFGMLKKSHLKDADTQVMVKTLSYAARSDTKYISRRIASETFGLYGTTATRSYTYDKAGNVTKINSTIGDSHTYEYDARGFLTKEDATSYAYDSNGNITQMGSVSMSYDNVIKDRLVKVGNTAVTYDANNPLNPASYGDKRYTFEGRRLTKFTTSSKQFAYKYNEQGLRIEKKSSDGTITKYVYDGNKLIAEIAPTYRLDFLYDEHNLLYGFVKDGSDKYFYVRDFMQNIIGIIDSNGLLVVQYNQTAYGKVTVLKDTANLANTNPFRYKGYYYDQESGMYYCQTRYYVPEWGRWLNSYEFFSISNVSSQNLNVFCYGNNNSVTKVQKTTNPIKSPSTRANGGIQTGWIAEAIIDKGITFFAGYDSDRSSNPISWLQTKVFYVEGGVLHNSIADLKLAVGTLHFRTPKLLNGIGLSENDVRNPNLFLDIDCLAAEATVGFGFSASAKLISGEIGFQLGDQASVGVQAYVGYGATLDFSTGFKIGLGLGYGFELDIKFDWSKILPWRW